MVTYVQWKGQRVTPYMAYQLDRLDHDIYNAFGVRVGSTSGIRTNPEQREIFLKRYVLAGEVRGRKVYDTRWWNGQLWYRISAAGTVAPPGSSNHEIQGTDAAVDIYDTGADAGITVKNSVRGRWIRQNAHKYDMVPEGDSFDEGWHFKMRNIFNAVPGGGSSAGSKTKEDKVKHLFTDDGKALRKGGLDLAAGGQTWLHKDAKAASSKASNLTHLVGEYSFIVHVYAEGKPGDIVDVILAWDNTKTSGAHSMHFVERIEIGADGYARRNVPFARPVALGYAVYAKLEAGKSNKGKVKITRFAVDALQFISA